MSTGETVKKATTRRLNQKERDDRRVAQQFLAAKSLYESAYGLMVARFPTRRLRHKAVKTVLREATEKA